MRPQTKRKESPREGPATKLLDGEDVLYVGKGSYVRDDSTKYPSKTELTGGFAGGERGVKQYLEEGYVSFDEESRPQVRSRTLVLRSLHKCPVPVTLVALRPAAEQRMPMTPKLSASANETASLGHEAVTATRVQTSPLIVALTMSGVAVVVALLWSKIIG